MRSVSHTRHTRCDKSINGRESAASRGASTSNVTNWWCEAYLSLRPCSGLHVVVALQTQLHGCDECLLGIEAVYLLLRDLLVSPLDIIFDGHDRELKHFDKRRGLANSYVQVSQTDCCTM